MSPLAPGTKIGANEIIALLGAGGMGEAHGARGEVDKAFEWLERAYFMRDSGIPLVRVHRQLECLHDDPRWSRFLERLGLGA